MNLHKCNRKHAYFLRLLGLCAVPGLLASCAAQKTSCRVIKLIADLNGTPQTNKSAGAELKKMSPHSIDGLMREIKKYQAPGKGRMMSAARCLRILRELKDPSVMKVATGMLDNLKPKRNKNEQVSRVLLSEAMFYLIDNFEQNTKARKAFIRLVRNRNKWRGKAVYLKGYSASSTAETALRYTRYDAEGWNLARDYPERKDSRLWVEYREIKDAQGLWCDIYRGLDALVKAEDPAAGPLLAEMLNSEPYFYGICWEYLAKDGFNARKRIYYKLPDQPGRFDWYDPKVRPRIVIMKWLGELKYHPSIPKMRKLLTSKHEDERDLALKTIQALEALREEPTEKKQNIPDAPSTQKSPAKTGKPPKLPPKKPPFENTAPPQQPKGK